VLQLCLLVRLAAGAVFVAFTRPQFDPVCVAQTSLMPLGAALAVGDGAVLLVVAVRVFAGTFGPRQMALTICVFGAAVWTGVSIFGSLGRW